VAFQDRRLHVETARHVARHHRALAAGQDLCTLAAPYLRVFHPYRYRFVI
jgi:hypothetical protein